jgi:hypothetical protein
MLIALPGNDKRSTLQKTEMVNKHHLFFLNRRKYFTVKLKKLKGERCCSYNIKKQKPLREGLLRLVR